MPGPEDRSSPQAIFATRVNSSATRIGNVFILRQSALTVTALVALALRPRRRRCVSTSDILGYSAVPRARTHAQSRGVQLDSESTGPAAVSHSEQKSPPSMANSSSSSVSPVLHIDYSATSQVYIDARYSLMRSQRVSRLALC